MPMKFTKMEGCGNDYIYVDGAKAQIPQEKKCELVKRLSDRHFGIGGDGVIFINPSDQADFEMEMYNMDGSRSEMCGNGMRCVGKYVYDHGLTEQTSLAVFSCGKIKYLQLQLDEVTGKVSAVKVNMGMPVLEAAEIPVVSPLSPVINETIVVDGEEYRMTCVSMGNPHAVIFVDEMIDDEKMLRIGPKFENHERFPNRTNTEFVEVVSRDYVKMRVWERGSGETLACGTGACAVAVACVLNGLTKEQVEVELLGGNLQIEWDRQTNLVSMTGPATTVFEGEMEL